MGLKRTDEFRTDAVRIALTSVLTRKQVVSDLGVGLSTLDKWVTEDRDTKAVSDKDLDLARVNERLRRENHILKEGAKLDALLGIGDLVGRDSAYTVPISLMNDSIVAPSTAWVK